MPSVDGSVLSTLDSAEGTNGMTHDSDRTRVRMEFGFLEAWILATNAAGL